MKILILYLFFFITIQCGYNSVILFDKLNINFRDGKYIDKNKMTLEIEKGVVLGEEQINMEKVEIVETKDSIILSLKLTDFKSNELLEEAEIFYGILIEEDKKTMVFEYKVYEIANERGLVRIKSKYFKNSYLIVTYIGYAPLIVKLIKKNV